MDIVRPTDCTLLLYLTPALDIFLNRIKEFPYIMGLKRFMFKFFLKKNTQR